MTRLAITLGIVVTVVSLATAGGFTEDFESYTPPAAISGANGWQEDALGDWFESEATTAGDPGCLGNVYGNLTNNGHSSGSGGAWLWKTFDAVETGQLVADFDVRFTAVGELDACNIFLCDSNRAPGANAALQIAALSADTTGLRVYDDFDWHVVDTSVAKNAWYHIWITVDMDAATWQAEIAAYDGEGNRETTKTALSYGGDSTFDFRDSAANDVGMIEFSATPTIMADGGERGFGVDNIHVPEPTTLCLLALAGAVGFRRRRCV